MKILILVQTSLQPPYDKLYLGQIQTWDSYKTDDVQTVYYCGGDTPMGAMSMDIKATNHDSRLVQFNCSDIYEMMHWKYKLTLDYVWNWEWDIIFRSNSSSYIDKEMLMQKALTMPKEKCYCGINGGNFASGAGLFLTRDVVKIFRDEFTDAPHPAEDVLMGEHVRKHGIAFTPGAERCDYWHTAHPVKRHYHYRCKSDTADRNKDLIAFREIYKLYNS